MKTKPIIPLTIHDRWLIIAGFRYALGRMTYVPSECVNFIIRNWGLIDPGTRALIARELEDEFAHDDRDRAEGLTHHALGDDCDRATWQKLRDAIQSFGEVAP